MKSVTRRNKNKQTNILGGFSGSKETLFTNPDKIVLDLFIGHRLGPQLDVQRLKINAPEDAVGHARRAELVSEGLEAGHEAEHLAGVLGLELAHDKGLAGRVQRIVEPVVSVLAEELHELAVSRRAAQRQKPLQLSCSLLVALEMAEEGSGLLAGTSGGARRWLLMLRL